MGRVRCDVLYIYTQHLNRSIRTLHRCITRKKLDKFLVDIKTFLEYFKIIYRWQRKNGRRERTVWRSFSYVFSHRLKRFLGLTISAPLPVFAETIGLERPCCYAGLLLMIDSRDDICPSEGRMRERESERGSDLKAVLSRSWVSSSQELTPAFFTTQRWWYTWPQKNIRIRESSLSE